MPDPQASQPPLLSIIVPVYGDSAVTRACIESIVAHTSQPFQPSQSFQPFQLIVIVDQAEAENPDSYWYVKELTLPAPHSLVKVFNNAQKWVNFNWNQGVEIASGEYIAIINNDIVLPPNWAKPLIELAHPSTKNVFACPFETNEIHKTPYSRSDGRDEESKVINGSCFVFHKMYKSLFPIPPQLVHWCGDYWLSDRALEVGNIAYTNQVVFEHALSHAGNKVTPALFYHCVLRDILEYEALQVLGNRDLSPRDLSHAKAEMYSALGVAL